MRRIAVLLALAAGTPLVPLAKTPDIPRSLLIRDVTLIDCTGAGPQPGMSILIRGGRIADIAKTSGEPEPKSARVIDGHGKFVIPGLWDMHGHLTDAGEGAMPLLIENGVTGVRDLGGDLDLVQRWRREIAEGKRTGPHIVAAGPFLDGPNEAKHRIIARNEAEAREAVRLIKSRGADFLKIHSALPRDAFFAAADEARKQGISMAVHLPQEVSIAEASDAGAKSLEHVEMLLQSVLLRKENPPKTRDEAFDELNGEKGAKLWELLVKNQTWFVPTLVAYERGFVLWSNKPTALLPRRSAHWKQIDLVAAMHKAGVKILAGSDFSDWALVPGVDLHNELALLVEAGFSPMEALQAATLLPARFLDKTADFGTIERGKTADLVLLDADPLESISHTRKIHAVVLGGRYLPIQELRDSMLPGKR